MLEQGPLSPIKKSETRTKMPSELFLPLPRHPSHPLTYGSIPQILFGHRISAPIELLSILQLPANDIMEDREFDLGRQQRR